MADEARRAWIAMEHAKCSTMHRCRRMQRLTGGAAASGMSTADVIGGWRMAWKRLAAMACAAAPWMAGKQ